MVLKRLFGTGRAKPSNIHNESGGRAYALSPEHALAQYAVTGTMHNTFYASAEEQLDTILSLVEKVSPEFVAKTAVYCRERGFMKDAPALLVAYLAKKDVGLMKTVFPRVVDNGKMLRNFVQIVRSGAIGHKSFGSAPKRAAQAWFASRSPAARRARSGAWTSRAWCRRPCCVATRARRSSRSATTSSRCRARSTRATR